MNNKNNIIDKKSKESWIDSEILILVTESKIKWIKGKCLHPYINIMPLKLKGLKNNQIYSFQD